MRTYVLCPSGRTGLRLSICDTPMETIAKAKPKTTVCIVNYKTELLTKICLRSIRKFTSGDYQVIVVDNASGDSSLEYLRGLKWIKLIERSGEEIRPGSWAHGSGLDLGLENCDSEYFVAMHSDTVIRSPDWLDILVEYAEKDGNTACSGSGKLEHRPQWMTFLKNSTDIKGFIRRISGRGEDFYIRTICALYKTQILKKENLNFCTGVEEGMTCGKKLYLELIRRGYNSGIVPASIFGSKVYHLAHATMVLNPEFKVRDRTREKCRRELEILMKSPLIDGLINDSSLDE